MRGLGRARRLGALAPCIAAAVLGATAGSVGGSSPAGAYQHVWPCPGYGAYQQCYDYSGQTYNTWHYVAISGEARGGYCAKGETSWGAVIQFSCTSNTYYAAGPVCTGTATHAYGYNNIGRENMTGEASTEGGC